VAGQSHHGARPRLKGPTAGLQHIFRLAEVGVGWLAVPTTLLDRGDTGSPTRPGPVGAPEPAQAWAGPGSSGSALVELAPMAGITNAGYRQLCREQGELGGYAERSVFVCEMITSRGLVQRDPKTLSMLQFDPGERIRSVQLYGVDPQVMAAATTILITEYGVGHVDLNFGCPLPKVTRKGGGAALP